MPDSQRRRAGVELIFPALLITLQLSLFGPHAIHSGNEAEFTASFWALERHLLLPASIILATLVGVGVALSGTWRRAYVAFLFSIGMVLWVQANLLVADYGPLNGGTIDWSVQSWRNKYEIALWVVVPALAVLAAKTIAPVAAFGSGVLLALQAALLMTSTLQADPRLRAEWTGPSDSMFELSRTRNVIHIVLDGFQSEVFHEILEEDRQILDKSLSGAVFFADHAGAFPTTMVSIPAMLTGTVYRNEEPLQKYVRSHFEKGSIFRSFRAAGYRVDSVTEMHYDSVAATNFYRLPRPYVSYQDYTWFAAWQLADLSLFRHAPHILRPKIYNEQAWRLQTLFGQATDTTSRRYHPVNGAVVLDELARRLTAGTDGPLYKFIHVGIPHQPIAVNANCDFIGVVRSTRESYKGQARCAVARAAAILDRLRALGLYDSSVIVIASDHGIGFTPPKFVRDRSLPPGSLSVLSAKAMALLIVKPPNSSGPVRVSYAPTAITDIPATVTDAAGVPHHLPGEPALKLAEDARRVRTFAMYDWEHEDWEQNYFEALDLLQIDGRLLDGNSWKLADSLYAPGTGVETRARGLYEPHRSSSGIAYRWGRPNVFLHAPPNARGFEITIRSIAPKPQNVTVIVGERVLQRLTLSEHNWVTLRHRLEPAADPSKVWVEIRVDPPWRPRGTTRDLGVMTRDIKWTP